MVTLTWHVDVDPNRPFTDASHPRVFDEHLVHGVYNVKKTKEWLTISGGPWGKAYGDFSTCKIRTVFLDTELKLCR